MKLIAENVEINVSGDKVEVDIYVNNKGNLVIENLPSVTYDMLGSELEFSK